MCIIDTRPCPTSTTGADASSSLSSLTSSRHQIALLRSADRMEQLRAASQLANALADEAGVSSVEAFRSALLRACSATWAAALGWAHVLWLVALPAYRICSLLIAAVYPHARHGVARAWAAFAAQERGWIAAELALAALGVLGWLAKRHIARRRYVPRLRAGWRRLSSRLDGRYSALLASIRSKSRTLAALFPHLAYFGAAGALALLAPASAVAGLSECGWVASVLFPLFASLAALRSAEPEAEAHWLQYWALYGLCALARGLALALPVLSSVSAGLLRTCPRLGLAELVLALWAHLPRAHATHLAFARARTLVHAAAPLGARAESEWAGLRALLDFGGSALGRKGGGGVLRALSDSGAMLLALLFLPMPRAVAHVGCLLFGLGYPAYTAVGAIVALEDAAARAARAALEPPPPAGTPSAVSRVGGALWRSADKLRRRASAHVRADEPVAPPARGGRESLPNPRALRASVAAAAHERAARTPTERPAAVLSGAAQGLSAERQLVRARLQYWLVRLLLALALSPLRPLLAWVPLVQQAELVCVALLQLPYIDGYARNGMPVPCTGPPSRRRHRSSRAARRTRPLPPSAARLGSTRSSRRRSAQRTRRPRCPPSGGWQQSPARRPAARRTCTARGRRRRRMAPRAQASLRVRPRLAGCGGGQRAATPTTMVRMASANHSSASQAAPLCLPIYTGAKAAVDAHAAAAAAAFYAAAAL